MTTALQVAQSQDHGRARGLTLAGALAGAVVLLKVAHHALKRDADHIAMMNAGAELIAQLQPEVVHHFNIFRPQSWRMRPEIDEHRRPVRRNDFQ